MSQDKEPEATASKPYHHGDLRNALVSAGRELLTEEGVSGLDLRKVARRAGVSHNAPYRHFADKQALLAAIAQEGFKELTTRIDAALASSPEDVRLQLLTIARIYVQFAVENPAYMREMFSGLTIQRSAYPELYAASKVAFNQLVALIQSGQAQGIIVPGDPMNHSLVVWSLMHGLAMLLLEDQIPNVNGDSAVIEQMLELSMRTLYQGLESRPK